MGVFTSIVFLYILLWLLVVILVPTEVLCKLFVVGPYVAEVSYKLCVLSL